MCSNAPELCISVTIHFFSNDSHTQTRNDHGLIPSSCYFYLLMVSPLPLWVQHISQCWASCLLHTLCLWELQSRPWAQKTCDSVCCPCLPPTLKAQRTERWSLEPRPSVSKDNKNILGPSAYPLAWTLALFLSPALQSATLFYLAP